MVITFYGASCFKAQSGDTVIAFNPPSKTSSYKSPRFQADIVLISSKDKDYNGAENLSGKNGGNSPFVIDGAGEYDVGGIHVKGVAVGENTIYTLSLENINLCHLGALKEDIISGDKEKIGSPDVVFAPIGGEEMGVISREKISGIIANLDAKIIIPSQYDKESLKLFLKEFGASETEPIDKLTFKKKDIADKQGNVVPLLPAM